MKDRLDSTIEGLTESDIGFLIQNIEQDYSFCISSDDSEERKNQIEKYLLIYIKLRDIFYSDIDYCKKIGELNGFKKEKCAIVNLIISYLKDELIWED